jgi:hypothetical protein
MYKIDSELRTVDGVTKVHYLIKRKFLFFWYPIYVDQSLDFCNEMLKKLQACYHQKDEDLIRDFERTLSISEKNANSTMQMSDESIVNLVKVISVKLGAAKKPGMESIMGAAACHALANVLHSTGSSNMQIIMTDVRFQGEEMGAYEIGIKRRA